MKILIIKLGALGDVINTLPLAVSLKSQLPCEIHWLVAPLSYPLVAGHESVDKVILFDRKKGVKGIWETVKQLRSQHYDLALDLQRILKSGLFTLSAKSRRRIGFDRNRCKELSWLFPFERIKASNPHNHMLDQYLEFLGHLGLENITVKWKIPRKGKLPGTLPKAYIVLNIGATKPANLWGPEHFSALVGQINETFGVPCALTGGPEDRETADRIISNTDSPVINLAGETTIPELIEVIANAFCVVSCDTGPMHLACALHTRVIALFGPADPNRTGPYHGHIIQKDIACAPCNKKQCSDPFCMAAITPLDVMAILKTFH